MNGLLSIILPRVFSGSKLYFTAVVVVADAEPDVGYMSDWIEEVRIDKDSLLFENVNGKTRKLENPSDVVVTGLEEYVKENHYEDAVEK